MKLWVMVIGWMVRLARDASSEGADRSMVRPSSMAGVRAVLSNAGCTFAALVGKSGDVATSELYMELIVDRTSHQFMFCGLGIQVE